MARQIKKSKAQIATIDCNLITIELASGEFGFETASEMSVEPQIDEQDKVTLISKGKLIAQKPGQKTITGHEITLTDNVFNPELVLALQGGTIVYDPVDPDKIVGYMSPVAGSEPITDTFTLNAYSAHYDAAGKIVQYEKISYPNCVGAPVAFSNTDGEFRAPEYVINSAPETGQSAYIIEYVSDLPVLVNEMTLGMLEVNSVAGAGANMTKITVSPALEVYTNKYMYATSSSAPTLPQYGEVINSGYQIWDGTTDITVVGGNTIIAVLEVDKDNKALMGGTATIVAGT